MPRKRRAQAARAWHFVAFQESPRQIIANAATFNWEVASLAPKKIFFLDAHLSPTLVKVGDFDLAGMLAILTAKKREMGAQWVVFDGIDVLLDAAAGSGRRNAGNLPLSATGSRITH
jgi:KaiC/GvpD/RAD55 family RecA-like ATPase